MYASWFDVPDSPRWSTDPDSMHAKHRPAEVRSRGAVDKLHVVGYSEARADQGNPPIKVLSLRDSGNFYITIND
jgi:hypothetical protein